MGICNHQWMATTSFRTLTHIIKHYYCRVCGAKKSIPRAIPKKGGK